jgi:hypothetical protein
MPRPKGGDKGICIMRAMIGAAALAVAIGICAPALSASTASEPSLDEVRKLTAKYQDVNVALAEGYIRDPANMCDTADMMGRPKELGAMGIHYFRPDMLGITAPPNPRVSGNGTHTDFRRPSILIYEPQADGSLKLVAVENLVFDKAWKAAGNSDFPTFQGQPYNAMADDPATAVDEAHMFEPHHDLHVWLYRDNPSGLFAQFNPEVSCAAHVANAAHGAHSGK